MTNRLSELEDEVLFLKDRIKFLEAALLGEWHAPPEFGLSNMEETVLRLLVSRGFVPYERMTAFLWGDRFDSTVVGEMNVLAQFIHRIRTKLAPFGFEVTTVRGRGYSLPEGTRKELRAWTQSLNYLTKSPTKDGP